MKMKTMTMCAMVLAVACFALSTAAVPAFAQQLAPVYGPTSSYKMQVFPPSSAPAPAYPNLAPVVIPDGLMYANISIGFEFTAFDVNYSTLVMNACGFLNFGDVLALPEYGEPQWVATAPSIFPFLSNYGFPVATVYTTTVGVAPFRTYVVRYTGITNQESVSATFDVLLRESVNSIEVNYFSMFLSPLWATSVLVGISNGPASNTTNPVDYVYLPLLNNNNISLLNLTSVVLTPITSVDHGAHKRADKLVVAV